MIAGLRNQVISLACLRLGLPAREARGVDQLPDDFKALLAGTLPKELTTAMLWLAFKAAIRILLIEAAEVDLSLADRLGGTLLAMSEPTIDA